MGRGVEWESHLHIFGGRRNVIVGEITFVLIQVSLLLSLLFKHAWLLP